MVDMEFTIKYLRMGHGDCILITTPGASPKKIMIDCGSDSAAVNEGKNETEITEGIKSWLGDNAEISALIITHYHTDHINMINMIEHVNFQQNNGDYKVVSIQNIYYSTTGLKTGEFIKNATQVFSNTDGTLWKGYQAEGKQCLEKINDTLKVISGKDDGEEWSIEIIWAGRSAAAIDEKVLNENTAGRRAQVKKTGEIFSFYANEENKRKYIKPLKGADQNAYSICTLVSFGQMKYLSIGDAEIDGMKKFPTNEKTDNITLLHIPHHGSPDNCPCNESDEDFDAMIDRLSPKNVIFTAASSGNPGPHYLPKASAIEYWSNLVDTHNGPSHKLRYWDDGPVQETDIEPKKAKRAKSDSDQSGCGAKMIQETIDGFEEVVRKMLKIESQDRYPLIEAITTKRIFSSQYNDLNFTMKKNQLSLAIGNDPNSLNLA
jgi:beta-lactamase superfamily II metal-dependent hydrolase